MWVPGPRAIVKVTWMNPKLTFPGLVMLYPSRSSPTCSAANRPTGANVFAWVLGPLPTGANVAAWGLGPNTVLSATKSWDDKHHHALGLGEAGLRSLFMREVVSLKDDDAMAEMAAAQSYTIYMAQLFVPPPDKLALPGTERHAKLALAIGSKFIGALKDDYLYVDSLPETRKAIMAKSMGNEEVFGFAPDWLFTAWSLRGQPGYWDPGLAGSPPKQVVGLLFKEPPQRDVLRMACDYWNWTMVIGLMPKEPALRDALRMAYTYWNWTVVHKAGLAEGASTAPGGLPKLVALDPAWADWLALQSPDDTVRAKEVWTGALRTLSKMAAMSGRLIVSGVCRPGQAVKKESRWR
eukprot:gene15097-21151_t